MKSSRDDEKINKEIQQGREEQGLSVPCISATTEPDLQGACLENYETLPKQDNSSTGKDIEPIFENEDDL
jgi:ribosomal protein S12